MAEQDLSKVDTNFQPAAVEGEAFAWTDARQAPIEVTRSEERRVGKECRL